MSRKNSARNLFKLSFWRCWPNPGFPRPVPVASSCRARTADNQVRCPKLCNHPSGCSRATVRPPTREVSMSQRSYRDSWGGAHAVWDVAQSRRVLELWAPGILWGCSFGCWSFTGVGVGGSRPTLTAEPSCATALHVTQGPAEFQVPTRQHQVHCGAAVLVPSVYGYGRLRHSGCLCPQCGLMRPCRC